MAGLSIFEVGDSGCIGFKRFKIDFKKELTSSSISEVRGSKHIEFKGHSEWQKRIQDTKNNVKSLRYALGKIWLARAFLK